MLTLLLPSSLQALLANIAALYAVYHGPAGLLTIAQRANGLAAVLVEGAKRLGLGIPTQPFFDTVAIKVRNQLLPFHLWLVSDKNALHLTLQLVTPLMSALSRA